MVPIRSPAAATMGHTTEEEARCGQDRVTGQNPARLPAVQRRTGSTAPHRGGVLRPQRRAHALPEIQGQATVRRFRCHRSWMQNGDRIADETIWNVLDCARGQRHRRSAMQPPQPQVRGLLGVPAGRMSFTNMSRTQRVRTRSR